MVVALNGVAQVSFSSLFIKKYYSPDLYNSESMLSVSQSTNQFFEIRLKVKNQSAKKALVDLSKIEIGCHGKIQPLLILEDNYEIASIKPQIKIKSEDVENVRLVFEISEDCEPQELFYNSTTVKLANAYGQDTIYMASFWKTSPRLGSKYYRLTSDLSKSSIISFFDVNSHELIKQNEVTNISDNNGFYTEFYEDGRIKEESFYENNWAIGPSYTYHDNGTKQSYKIHKPRETRYIQAWDDKGNELLKNGTGFYSILNENGNVNFSIIENHDLVSSFEYRAAQKDSVYTLVTDQPEPAGGMKEFYKFISSNLNYPNIARRRGTEGKVFIQFIIDKKGSATEVTTVKGIGDGCDKESERVIKMSPRWIPGKLDGQPVKVRMILPLTFKLAG